MIRKEIKYTRIAKRLIKSDPDLEVIKDSDVRIAFLASDEEKTKDYKKIFAECRKVNKQYSWCCPYDFMITVYEPNIINFDEDQIEILIFHELLHIGINNEGNEPSYYIIPHDVEEFWRIIHDHGLTWQEERHADR